MRDAFYTILVIWIIWKIINAVSAYGSKKTGNTNSFNQEYKQDSEGETSIMYAPPDNSKISDDVGEYVDFEEIKDDKFKK